MLDFNWTCKFISELCNNNEVCSTEYYYKALGEFALFTYIINQKTNNIPIRELQSTCKCMANSLNKTLSKDSPVANRILLLNYLARNQKHRITDKLKQEILRVPSEHEISIEHLFLVERVDPCFDIQIWRDIAISFVQKCSKNGLNLSEMYHLTHVVFFATNFGKKKEKIFSELLSSILGNLLESTFNYARKNKNWDLLIEAILGILFLKNNNSSPLSLNLLHWNTIKTSIKSSSGWYLSNGTNILYYEKNYNTLQWMQKYSLFHTTILATILEVEVACYNNFHKNRITSCFAP